MKITRIETLILKTPLGKERFWSSQATFPERKCLLVRIETDAGITGWGEAGQYGPAEPVATHIHDVFAPMLLGENPCQPVVHWERMYNHTRDFGAKGSTVEAISGIDIALWDILGKARKAPVYELMGGAFRTRGSDLCDGAVLPRRGVADAQGQSADSEGGSGAMARCGLPCPEGEDRAADASRGRRAHRGGPRRHRQGHAAHGGPEPRLQRPCGLPGCQGD